IGIMPDGGGCFGVQAVGSDHVFAWHPDARSPVNAIAFSPVPPRVLSGDDQGRVALWDVLPSSGLQPVSSRKVDIRIVRAIAFSPDGKNAAIGGAGNEALILDVSGRQIGEATTRIREGPCDVWGAAYSPDGRFVATSSDDGKIALWDVRAG